MPVQHFYPQIIVTMLENSFSWISGNWQNWQNWWIHEKFFQAYLWISLGDIIVWTKNLEGAGRCTWRRLMRESSLLVWTPKGKDLSESDKQNCEPLLCSKFRSWTANGWAICRWKKKYPKDHHFAGFEPNVFSFIGKWLTHLRFKIDLPEKLRIWILSVQ